MQSSDTPLKIEERDLENYTGAVSKLLQTVSVRKTERTSRGGYARSSTVQEIEETVEIMTQACLYGSKDCTLLADKVNHALHVVQRGAELGLHISELYKNSSGLEMLNDQNKQANGFKTEAERVEFNKKNQTAARIARFVTAYYVLHELTGYHTDAVESVSLPNIEKPELDDQGSRGSIITMVFYYGDVIERLQEKTPEAFVKLTKTYFQHILDEVKESADSLAYSEPFTSRAYKLEDSEFVVHGFVTESRSTAVSAQFSRLSFDDIVGNREAKHEARRTIFQLGCYDPETQKNPYKALTGHFQGVKLGSGVPGTGKSMQIAATATALAELCEKIGIPFIFHPLDGTVVSTFQGGSAERMKAWFSVFNNPKSIIYAPIDDAEQLFQNRTDQGVSAGVQEVISQFLTGTEGATAYWREWCNVLIETMTNLPEKIDPAVMSRHQARFPINGARRYEDFLDQDHLWWKKFKDTVPEFTAEMKNPSEYDYMSLQGKMESLSDSLEHYTEPKNPTMQAIFNRVLGKHNIQEFRFFAELATAVQAEFPKFSSRETRNIQSAISARMVDFDAPDEWMEDPEKFFRLGYDKKLILLKDLMHENMGSLKLQDVWVQEICRYLDVFADIEEKQFRRDVATQVANMRVMKAAQAELTSQ